MPLDRTAQLFPCPSHAHSPLGVNLSPRRLPKSPATPLPKPGRAWVAQLQQLLLLQSSYSFVRIAFRTVHFPSDQIPSTLDGKVTSGPETAETVNCEWFSRDLSGLIAWAGINGYGIGDNGNVHTYSMKDDGPHDVPLLQASSSHAWKLGFKSTAFLPAV